MPEWIGRNQLGQSAISAGAVVAPAGRRRRGSASPAVGRAEPAVARPPDLRLAVVAAGAWLAALACLHASAPAGFGGGVAAALSALALGCWPRPGRARRILVGLLIGMLCGAVATAARIAQRDAPQLAALARGHATVRMRLKVLDDPRPVPGSGSRPPAFAVPASVGWVRVGDGPAVAVSARILVLASDPGWRGLLPGTSLVGTGRLGEPRGGDLTAAVLSTAVPPDQVGPAPWSQRAAGVLRAGLRRACAPLPAAPGGLLPGLVDGDTSRLDPAVADDFRATGMTHLVAVSGANLAIVAGVVLLLARWCRAGPRLAAGLCGLALVGFVILARPSPSVLRAAVMAGLGLLGLAAGRPRAALPALSGAAFLLLLVDPARAADAGFALSVGATAGLLLLAPGFRDALRRHRVPAGLAEALAVPAGAEVACAPVIAGISGTVSLVAVPANLFAEPAVAPATVLGVAAALLSPVWPDGAAFLAWLASWPARWLVLIARYGAGAPAGLLPWPGGLLGALLLAGLLAAGLFLARHRAVRVAAGICAVAAALGAVPVRLIAAGWPPAGALLVVCDVGQGDSLVLPLGAGRAVVVDAGPEPAATDRCLRGLGVREVALLVVSHFHADHVGGIEGVFRGRRVDRLALPAYHGPAGGYDAVLASARVRAVPLVTPEPGWSWLAGPVRLTVLGPVGRMTGTDSDPNNNSLVLRVDEAGMRLLLAGDAEVAEQTAVLAAGGAAPLRADVLKVAHHGSAYQDPAFLDAVHPAVALVSVGLGNPYGHPSATILDRLRRSGARVLRTDLDGDIAAVRDHNGLATVRHGTGPGRHPP